MTESCYLLLLLLLQMLYGHYISCSCRNSTHFCLVLWMVERIVFSFYSNWIEIKSQTIVSVCMYQFFEGEWDDISRFWYFLVIVSLIEFMLFWLFVAIDTDASCCWTLTQQTKKKKKHLAKYCCITHFQSISPLRSSQMNNLSLFAFCLLDFWWWLFFVNAYIITMLSNTIISLIPNYWNIWCVNSFIYSVVFRAPFGRLKWNGKGRNNIK